MPNLRPRGRDVRFVAYLLADRPAWVNTPEAAADALAVCTGEELPNGARRVTVAYADGRPPLVVEARPGGTDRPWIDEVFARHVPADVVLAESGGDYSSPSP